MANDAIVLYRPGADLSCIPTTAVVGKRCVKLSASRSSGPGLSSTSEGGNYKVAPADAGERILGVAGWDEAAGGLVNVICGPGVIVPIYAGAAIAFDEEVEVGATGKVIPRNAGVAIGRAMTAALIDTDAEIRLY